MQVSQNTHNAAANMITITITHYRWDKPENNGYLSLRGNTVHASLQCFALSQLEQLLKPISCRLADVSPA